MKAKQVFNQSKVQHFIYHHVVYVPSN